MTKCKCESPGYCQTHQRKMCAIRHAQCKNEPGYFEAFQLDLKRKEQPILITKSRGFGDQLKWFFDWTGISWLSHKYEQKTGKSCGCKGRQEKLNKLFPNFLVVLLFLALIVLMVILMYVGLSPSFKGG